MCSVVNFDHSFLIEIENFQKLNKKENSRSKKCECLLEVSHSWCLTQFLPVDTLHSALQQPEICLC
jgi:hypothetical protein